MMKQQIMTPEGDPVISRGEYLHPRADGFVKVTEYAILRRHGGRFLLLRLSNDLDVTVDCVTCTVIQPNAHGDMLAAEKTQVTFHGLAVSPGCTVTPAEAIPLRGSGSDFRVEILSADSGAYRYTWDGERLSVAYRMQQPWTYRDGMRPGDGHKPSLTARSVMRRTSVGLPALVAVLAVLALAAVTAAPYLPYFAGPLAEAWGKLMAQLTGGLILP